MPYSTSSTNLPEYVKKLSDKLKEGWIAVFNAAFEKYGESQALLIANAWLKKQVPARKMIKRSVVVLDLDTSSGFIKRSRSGEEYVTFVLNSTQPHRDGKVFSESMLKKWAKTINENPTMVGDVDHLLYDKVLDSSISDETARSILKNKPGIAKMVQAVYEKGKLWVRAIIDKRYKKIVEKSKGVSAEAYISNWDGEVATDGDLLGFTFNVNTTPADYSAGVVA
jgi:hypothetical protein